MHNIWHYEILNNYWMRSSRIWGIIKAEVYVICRNSSYLRGPNSIIVLLFICKYFFQDWGIFSLKKPFVFSRFQQKPHKLAWRHILKNDMKYEVCSAVFQIISWRWLYLPSFLLQSARKLTKSRESQITWIRSNKKSAISRYTLHRKP